MTQHGYRVEIGGGFSGSAHRYHSFLTGSLESALGWVEAEARDEQGGSMLVTEGFDVVIELLEDGACRVRRPVLPALRITAGELTITFGDDGAPALDGEALDEDALQERIDEIVDAFAEGAEVSLDASKLGLPQPAGEPILAGTRWRVTNLAGVEHEQISGEVVGDLMEAWGFAAPPGPESP